MKKIFLVAKVHEMEPTTLASVQQEIQNDFDSVTGDRRVVFSACNPSDNEFEFTFNRTSLQNLVEEAKINSVISTHSSAWMILLKATRSLQGSWVQAA